jgi:hypothetical protein
VAAGDVGLGVGSGWTVDGGSSGESISEGGSGRGCDDVATVAKVEGSSFGYSVTVVRRVTITVSSAMDKTIAKTISAKVATLNDGTLAIVKLWKKKSFAVLAGNLSKCLILGEKGRYSADPIYLAALQK